MGQQMHLDAGQRNAMQGAFEQQQRAATRKTFLGKWRQLMRGGGFRGEGDCAEKQRESCHRGNLQSAFEIFEG